VDALVGTQLRYHGDLDLVVDDLAGQSDALAAALAPLGFEPRGNRQTGTWWLPEGADFARPKGPAIEVLEVDWDLLASVRSLVDVDLDPEVLRDKLRSACLGTGRLGPPGPSPVSPCRLSCCSTRGTPRGRRTDMT
jgi:hypothetical protein